MTPVETVMSVEDLLVACWLLTILILSCIYIVGDVGLYSDDEHSFAREWFPICHRQATVRYDNDLNGIFYIKIQFSKPTQEHDAFFDKTFVIIPRRTVDGDWCIGTCVWRVRYYETGFKLEFRNINEHLMSLL